ncbi:MAG: thiamine phosphate synthase, partial [Sciscionella sp.]
DGTAIRRRLDDARLYLCTDARTERGDLAEFVDAALSGGVDIVQLRDKSSGAPLEAAAELAALEVIGAACVRRGALLAVNDRADVALAAGADVLHLGQDDLPVEWARKILGNDIAVGRSTHDSGQVRAASVNEDIDYFCVGPCWPTPTKPGRDSPGLTLVRSTAEPRHVVTMPWFAIGGIDLARLAEVLAAGATRVVVVRAITEAEDPRAAAAALSRRLRSG